MKHSTEYTKNESEIVVTVLRGDKPQRKLFNHKKTWTDRQTDTYAAHIRCSADNSASFEKKTAKAHKNKQTKYKRRKRKTSGKEKIALKNASKDTYAFGGEAHIFEYAFLYTLGSFGFDAFKYLKNSGPTDMWD